MTTIICLNPRIGDTEIYIGRRELEHGYEPKYSLGEIVDYDGQIAIIRSAPDKMTLDRTTISYGLYQVDYLHNNIYYTWDMSRDGQATECEIKPYKGKIPEFMNFLKKAVLQENGYILNIDNCNRFDQVAYFHNVIDEFDKIKDELIDIVSHKPES